MDNGKLILSPPPFFCALFPTSILYFLFLSYMFFLCSPQSQSRMPVHTHTHSHTLTHTRRHAPTNTHNALSLPYSCIKPNNEKVADVFRTEHVLTIALLLRRHARDVLQFLTGQTERAISYMCHKRNQERVCE